MFNIKRQVTWRVVGRVALGVGIGVLLYSRLVNLGWGLPYPMHPDERNMVDAVSRLHCDDPGELVRDFVHALSTFHFQLSTFDLPLSTTHTPTCLNPEFFAYGQFTLYLAFFMGKLMTFWGPDGLSPLAETRMSFSQAAIALRLIAAASSLWTVWYIIRIVTMVRGRLSGRERLITMIVATWVPVAIQMAHFGTTESLLALLYTILTYWSLRVVRQGQVRIRDMVKMGILIGISLGVKVSAVTYVALPLFLLAYLFCVKIVSVYRIQSQVRSLTAVESDVSTTPTLWPDLWPIIGSNKVWQYLIYIVSCAIIYVLVVVVWALISSPYNLILSQQLRSSMSYESGVGVGYYIPFYTRQFLLEVPIFFHMHRVLPYALGNPLWVLALAGCCCLSWRSRTINMLRFAVIVMLFSNGFLYAKWTRFLAPLYPLLTTIGILVLLHILHAVWMEKLSHRLRVSKYSWWALITIWVIMPGVAYLSVYTQTDVRYAASRWMYEHMAPGTQILSETANVVDIPLTDEASGTIRPPGFTIQNTSFDFYELDTSPPLQARLKTELAEADYIIIPSRRVFYNHTCRQEAASHKPQAISHNTWTTTRHSPEKCAYLKERYPQLDRYYDELFSGRSGFVKVAEFSSYPQISVAGIFTIILPDEDAEETFTVFDHPVIRIYQRAEMTDVRPKR